MPKFIILFAMIGLLSAQTAMAQNKEVLAVEKAILQLKDAMLSGEASSLRNISSKNLTYGHSNGTIEDQEAFIEALASGNNDFTSITLTDQHIDVVGKVALVRHNLSGNTHNKGAEPAEVKLGVLLVWQKEGKDWKLLARQAFKR